MAAEGYTIGEVLNQLKEDFEDITISKIRFLESEGLIYPDRTESGYRKFTVDDVDRLRFILTAQRDHYLPLKVIRDQLERLDAGEIPDAGPGPPGPPAPPANGEGAASGGTLSGDRAREISRAIEQATAVAAEQPQLEEPAQQVELSLRELCESTGLAESEVRALREFGILGDREEGTPTFDGDDLLAAGAARELLRLGLEPRHLRMYRHFIEREVSLFEQLVTPLLRQRNPEARRQASRQLEQLASLTGQLERVLLARALRRYVHGS